MATVWLNPVVQSKSPWGALRSLRLLLPVTYLALVILSVGGLIIWAGFQARTTHLTEVGNDLELQARLIANAIEEPLVRWEELEYGEDDDDHAPSVQSIPLDATLIRLATAAAESTTSRVVLTDARLRVLYSSDDTAPVGMMLQTPEFTTQTRDIRLDAWTQKERVFVAAPLVKPGGALAGYVQLSVPMNLIYRQNTQTWIGLLLAGGSVTLLTALISLGLAHFILHPIGALTRGAEVVAAGDLTQQVHPAGPEELRRLATAFNLMTERLRDLLARQRDFVAHAAHELRTPLTALSLRLELVQIHGAADPALAAHYLAQMNGEIDHLRRLSEQLLALAALDAHELPTRVPLDLAPLLYKLADDFGPYVQHAGHPLHVEVPPHLPLVVVNADQIQAAIRNLLDNAAKYSTPDGVITLSAVATSRTVEIAVTDTGPGIPAEALPRIFDRFYRVDRARARKLGGTGLGLALVKGVAEAYGGHVEVQSQSGKGSRFVVSLPLMKAQRLH
jgi:signal transduction histidine kinase